MLSFHDQEGQFLALFRHGGGVELCPFLEAKQKTSAKRRETGKE
jgi:hypothetical protein